MNFLLRKLFSGFLATTLLLTSYAAQRPEGKNTSESEETLLSSETGQSSALPAEETEVPSEKEESGILSDKIHAILLPEKERETKLESLLSFEIGSNGLFSYFWLPCEYGIEHSFPNTPSRWCADSENRIYVVLNEQTKREGDILRLNDGKVYESPQGVYPYVIECVGKMIYMSNNVYGSDGSEFMTLDTESGEWQTLTVPETVSGEIVALKTRDGEAYWYDENAIYTLAGDRLPEEGLSVTEFRLDEKSGGLLLEKGDEKGLLLDEANIMPLLEGYTDYEDSKLLVRSRSRNKEEEVFFQLDGAGRLTSEFMVTMTSKVTQPCSFPFEPYEGSETVTLETYEPRTVKIGSYVFEDAIFRKIFFGEDGTMYLVVFYLDHGDLYKILPGYEKISFTEETEQTVRSDDIQVAFPTPDTPSVHPHPTTSMGEASIRAEKMIDLQWTLSEDNIKVLPGTKRPEYIDIIVSENGGKANNALVTGIPYCWGGFNGVDTVGKNLSFAEAVKGSVMAGNATASGYYKEGTAGVDCSGFVSSAFGLSTKMSTFTICDYCTEIEGTKEELIDLIKGGDLLDQPGGHVIFVHRVTITNNVRRFELYESTLEGLDLTIRRTVLDEDITDLLLGGYRLFRPNYFNDNYVCKDPLVHWRACNAVTPCEQIRDKGFHKMMPSPNNMCSICGYRPVLP